MAGPTICQKLGCPKALGPWFSQRCSSSLALPAVSPSFPALTCGSRKAIADKKNILPAALEPKIHAKYALSVRKSFALTLISHRLSFYVGLHDVMSECSATETFSTRDPRQRFHQGEGSVPVFHRSSHLRGVIITIF